MVAALSKPGDSAGIAVTRRLLSYGGDVNQPDFLGRTPLQYAVRSGNIALVELLLKKGANPNCIFKYHECLMRNEADKWCSLFHRVERQIF